MRKNNNLNQDEKVIEKTKKNFLWVQEFSKKIIVATFLLYVLYNIVSILILVYSTYHMGMMSGFETLTTEINQTFRLIIGGYLVKAGFENVTKIGGSYYDNVNKIKLAKMREENGLSPINEEDDFVSDVDENTIETSLGPEELS